jgi:hypothetical protein
MPTQYYIKLYIVVSNLFLVEAIGVTASSTKTYLSECSICNDDKEITNENEKYEVRSSSLCHNIHLDSSDSSIILTKEVKFKFSYNTLNLFFMY